jgi:hypothetical protein
MISASVGLLTVKAGTRSSRSMTTPQQKRRDQGASLVIVVRFGLFGKPNRRFPPSLLAKYPDQDLNPERLVRSER